MFLLLYDITELLECVLSQCLSDTVEILEIMMVVMSVKKKKKFEPSRDKTNNVASEQV